MFVGLLVAMPGNLTSPPQPDSRQVAKKSETSPVLYRRKKSRVGRVSKPVLDGFGDPSHADNSSTGQGVLRLRPESEPQRRRWGLLADRFCRSVRLSQTQSAVSWRAYGFLRFPRRCSGHPRRRRSRSIPTIRRTVGVMVQPATAAGFSQWIRCDRGRANPIAFGGLRREVRRPSATVALP